MEWIDTVIASLEAGRKHIINDSKTPSGRVHVGALRGVLIHDAVYREVRLAGMDAEYMFGVDDYDPLDELPAGLHDYFAPYLGRPLCNVPPPPGSNASDLAEHYISEFFDVFSELGVGSTTYRMRDVYRSGRFNDAIRRILAHADIVRRVYKEVSNSERPGDWYPFQVICERCGRIGTTRVYDFDGEVVRYQCRPDLVAWAKGCGHSGAISPFDGNGKLPWKLEWAAKWHTFRVDVEGAGKDHTTRGGAREVAAACLREIFGEQPPRNIPYEFFLVGGAKMSSSRGVGVSAREMASLLPPEVLRFLVLKNPPNRPVNFSPDEKQLVKLFNEYDRLRVRAFTGRSAAGSSTARDDGRLESDGRLFALCQVHPSEEIPEYQPPFQLLTTLLQMPHVDVFEEARRRKGSELTETEARHLRRRVASARYWLDRYAREEDKFEVQSVLPRAVGELSSTQRAFLHRLSHALQGVPWTEECVQSLIFDVARLTPVPSAQAFEAIYMGFLDRRIGPRAGSLVAFLPRDVVVARLLEIPHSVTRFWLESSESLASFEQWLLEARDTMQVEQLHFELFTSVIDCRAADTEPHGVLDGIGVVECLYSSEGKRQLRRARFSTVHSSELDPEGEFDRFKTYAGQYVHELEAKAAGGAIRSTCSWRHEDLSRSTIEAFGG